MAHHPCYRFLDCLQVWKIRADIRIMDAAGNVTDAVFLCCLTALMAFKRPDVTVEAGEGGGAPMITVHPVEEREAIPLTLHQAPMAVSFALFQVTETRYACFHCFD